MSKFSSPSSNPVILVINFSLRPLMTGDRVVKTIEMGLDAGLDEGRDPDLDLGIANCW